MVPATGGYDGVSNRLSVTATLNTSYAPASYSGTTGYTYDGGTTGGPGNPTSFKGTANTFNSDNQVMT